MRCPRASAGHLLLVLARTAGVGGCTNGPRGEGGALISGLREDCGVLFVVLWGARGSYEWPCWGEEGRMSGPRGVGGV